MLQYNLSNLSPGEEGVLLGKKDGDARREMRKNILKIPNVKIFDPEKYLIA